MIKVAINHEILLKDYETAFPTDWLEKYNFSEMEVPYDDVEFEDFENNIFSETKYSQRKNKLLNTKYIPSATKSMIIFAKVYLKTNHPHDTEEKLMFSGLYDTYDPNNPKKREVGDLFNAVGQTWETIQAYDENIYPDINPDNPQTWHTFNKPLHGKSKETARPFIKPQYGTTDMYLKGEYAVFPEGIKRATMDTVFSPEEYAAAWEDVE